MVELVWLLPALPLVGVALLVLFGRRMGEPASGWLATAMCTASFVVALVVFVGLVDQPEHTFEQVLWEWIPVGDFRVDVGFLLDPLSMAMALFITGVAALIHLYSIGYMHGDPRFPTFFLYLNLFVASMLVLVLGDNLLLTFVGWEGVGACSYFLISFWFERDENASAGKKAFITNRVGDWGFMVGTFATYFALGTISYTEFLPLAPGLAATTATFIAGMLFIGAIGKSAQIPLFIWLPDAMAGPTPVSALIHAATMVTAGVYLMCRISPVLGASYDWLPEVIAWVGVLTALVAAFAAMGQMDIKKALAYSTISQLGYMFLAVGVGAYWAAIFHMITHAFFKACLFLGSGSVIHGMHEEQDMRRMGGLRRFMPITAGTFIVATLAIAGVPPLSGFWSKDEILAYALQANPALYAVGLFTALLTAYYMSRVAIRTFYGEPRWPAFAAAGAGGGEPGAVEPEAAGLRVPAQAAAGAAGGLPTDADIAADPEPPHNEHLSADFVPHESPWTMTVPLVVLAGLSVVGGLLNLPISGMHFLEDWLEPVFALGDPAELGYSGATIVALLGVSTAVALAGVALAAYVWLWERFDGRRLEPAPFVRAWYVDRLITDFVGGPGEKGFEGIEAFDRVGIDGAVNDVGRLTRGASARIRVLQSGFLRTYALLIGVGSILLIAYVLTQVLVY